MRIKCLHGYFLFEEQRCGQVSDFMSLFGFDLVAKDNYFTFAELEDAPDFSLKGLDYLGATATATFEGKPWEVMEANGLVFNFSTGELAQIATISARFDLSKTGNHFSAAGLILPGSLTDDGNKVKDYLAWFSVDTMRFRYSEVGYV